jgi:phage repressor protein C with HTH and peptisase S24 domain
MATRSQILLRAYLEEVMRVRDWTSTQLARESGVAPSTINRFLNDKNVAHELSLVTLRKIAVASGVPIPSEVLPSEEKKGISEPNVDLTQRTEWQAGPKDLPVMGRAAGGGLADWYEMTGEVDRVERPPALEAVTNGYALFMSGTSMEPRYYAGETIYIHPDRPITRDCFVVVQLYPENDGDAVVGLVKQFIRRSDHKIVLRQLNPPDSPLIEYPMKRVKAIHRIVLGGDR